MFDTPDGHRSHVPSAEAASAAWQRMDAALEADNLAVTFNLRGLADEILLEEELGRDICRDDPIVLAELRKLKGYETSFGALHTLVQKMTCSGCSPSVLGKRG